MTPQYSITITIATLSWVYDNTIFYYYCYCYIVLGICHHNILLLLLLLLLHCLGYITPHYSITIAIATLSWVYDTTIFYYYYYYYCYIVLGI